MTQRLFSFALIVLLAALAGCASVSDTPVEQQVLVVPTCHGQTVQARCTLTNSKGVWQLNAPGSVVVQRDMFSLQVMCRAPFFGNGAAEMWSAPNSKMFGNVFLGGVLGAGVDAATGSGLGYANTVHVPIRKCSR